MNLFNPFNFVTVADCRIMPLIFNGSVVTKLPDTIQEFLQFAVDKNDHLKVVFWLIV